MLEKIKILATDSGLGGLSVAAELFERIKREKQFEDAEIIFFNCRPSDTSGYNPLGSTELKTRVFSKALYAMCERFEPTIIMIACNTLSAIYDKCEFAESPLVPVVGIIDDGVAKIAELMTEKPELKVALFGTPTTVNSRAHKDLLIERGFDPARLVYQTCPGLPTAIDRGAGSGEVRRMIGAFVKEASEKALSAKFAIALLCTHFGYSLPFFRESAEQHSGFSGDIINPNSEMVKSFLANYESDAFTNANVAIKCFSHSTITDAMKTAMRPLIADISPDAADALLETTHTPDMFGIGD